MAEPTRAMGGAKVRGALAIAALALAVLFAVLYRVDNSSEDHSYNSGAKPPASVRITAGRQYEISTPGGADALGASSGVGVLNCNYTAVDGTSTRQLDTTGLGGGSRTTHAVATFIAPVTGVVRIECRGLSETFIDDADDVSPDPAGRYLVLCTIALSIGAWLGLSALYRRRVERGYGPRDDDLDDATGTGPEAPDGGYGQLLAAPTDS